MTSHKQISHLMEVLFGIFCLAHKLVLLAVHLKPKVPGLNLGPPPKTMCFSNSANHNC